MRKTKSVDEREKERRPNERKTRNMDERKHKQVEKGQLRDNSEMIEKAVREQNQRERELRLKKLKWRQLKIGKGARTEGKR
jgi:hypothetical protein